MPEKFCSTCRNTGFVVVRDKAETIRITKTRCPHCPPKPPPRVSPVEFNRRGVASRTAKLILVALLISAVGIEILILAGGLQ